MKPAWSGVRSVLTLAICLLASVSGDVFGQQTQRQYLSGRGKDDAIPWQFRCTAGRRANEWTTIAVPSNWELQGFGTFSYGNESRKSFDNVQGQYKTTFTAPPHWSSARVFLVFEGSMTDTEAKVNGQSAGPIHQGGYYRFKYEITKLLKFGESNELDVTVNDESANKSVNAAERRGDYWNYGGIFRPVYLECVPNEFIDRVAIDARADGALAVDVFGNGVADGDVIEAQTIDQDGNAIDQLVSQPMPPGEASAHLKSQISNPLLWTAETPNLYQLEVRLKKGQSIVHSIRQRFGFRTIEVRPGDGVYVNGRRVMLKGSDRHSFWPDSGRCTSEQISRDDVRLMKEMNMNAVRMSHYPPDQHFLETCDEVGLYVLDELAGWHHFYDEPTGRRLVEEMITRDVNHPSIVFWDNGNEGGWNTKLDDDFAKWDPQQRHVLHPWMKFGDIDTKHYPNFARLKELCAGDTIVMPTEFAHGLYDGGAGAGLADYWQTMTQSKVCAGGFIWAFLDEAVKRVDQDGKLDTHGTNAPDGILGPYREKEASFYTIKKTWSPVTIALKELPADFDSRLTVENHYSFTDAQQCAVTWQLRTFRKPNDSAGGFLVSADGKGKFDSSIPPGASGGVKIELPANWRDGDALAVRIDDPHGQELWTWVWPLAHTNETRDLTAGAAAPVSATETADDLIVTTGNLTATFNKHTGLLSSVTRSGKPFALSNGPRLVNQRVGEPASTEPVAVASFEHHDEAGDCLIDILNPTGLKSVRWRIRGDGSLHCDYQYTLTGPQEYFGVGFDFPASKMLKMKWLGDGPYRVWKNRLDGGTLNVWENGYNETITGSSLWKYPEFAGYYANVRWAKFESPEGSITAVLSPDHSYLQVLSSKPPEAKESRNVSPPFPSTGISFLHAIPAIGSKFLTPAATGPQSQPAVAEGEYRGSFSLFFDSK